MKQALTYDDVLLVPQYSDIESRKEIDIGNVLHEGVILDLPVISSPMDTVSEDDMARVMCSAGGLTIVHRYNTVEKQCKIIRSIRASINDTQYVGAAIGVTGDYFKRALQLLDSGANIICIDVAHGHHILVKNAIKSIRSELGNQLHIMAGNVATREGFEALSDWGANSVRCNVGGGSICSTRIQTGHGIPGLQTIFDCAESDRDAKIIADGGIRNSGDIVKALAAGADFVMLGSMLAGTDASPGFIIEDTNNLRYKLYRGMASKEAQIAWRGEYSSNEGISTQIPYKGKTDSVLNEIKNGIASGFSYSGARNINQLWVKARFVKQTSAGLGESKTHILGK